MHSEQFCDYSSAMRGFSPQTIVRYRTVIRLLQRHEEINTLEECTEEKLLRFFHRGRTERDWTPSTFATYHKSLNVFFRWCVERQYMPKNPVERIELPKIPKSLPKGISSQEATRVLEIIRNYPYKGDFERFRNYALIATFVYAGLRKQELLHLQTADVDIAHRSIFVRQGKGGKDRIIPIDTPFDAILQLYIDERIRARRTCPEFFALLNHNAGLTDMGLRRLIWAVNRISGLKFTPHQLRHTFATLMIEGGSEIFALSKMMGHSNIKTTTIYLSATPEHLRAQMAKHPLNSTSIVGVFTASPMPTTGPLR